MLGGIFNLQSPFCGLGPITTGCMVSVRTRTTMTDTNMTTINNTAIAAENHLLALG